MNKNRQILSGLQGFFRHNNSNAAIQRISTVADSLTIQSKVVGPVKNPNCKFTFVQVVKLLIVEVVNVIAGFISCDPFELIENVINNNEQIKAVRQAFDRLEMAGTAA